MTVAKTFRLKGFFDSFRWKWINALTDGQLLVGQTHALPEPKTISGDATLDKDGVLSLSEGAVSADKLEAALVDALASLTVTAAAEADNKRILTIQAKDALGNNLTVATYFWLELLSAADASYAVSDEGAGAIVYDNTTMKKTLIQTNAAGLAQIGITDTAVETILVGVGAGAGTGYITAPAPTSLAFT